MIQSGFTATESVRRGSRTRIRVMGGILGGLLVCAGTIGAEVQPWSGTVDPTFDPGDGADGSILAMIVQSDDRILLGGGFSSVDGVPRNRIARLLPDGALDPEFDPGAGPDGDVIAMAPQPDGRILILGPFTAVAGTNRNQIARLNNDGSLDDSFDAGAGAIGTLDTLKLQADGRILVGGDFEVFQGLSRNNLVRLQSDGTVETGFGAPFTRYGRVHALGLSPAGDIYAGGTIFVSSNENGSPPLAKLNSDGVVASEFFRLGVMAYYPERIRFLEYLAEGTLLVGGEFVTVGNAYSWGVAYLDSDGKPLLQQNASVPIAGVVECFAELGEGRILVGGDFVVSDYLPRKNLALIGPDGVNEPFAHAGVGVDGPVIAMARQSDDKVVIAGSFSDVDGTSVHELARLEPGPAPARLPFIVMPPIDQALLEGQALELGVEAISYETPEFQWFHDGRLIVGATNRIFSSRIVTPDHSGTYHVEVHNGAGVVTSLDAAISVDPVPESEGSIDVTFNANLKSPGVGRILLMGDGGILVSGYFRTAEFRLRTLAKFGPDGALDPTFAAGYATTSPWDPDGPASVYDLIVQQDGKLLIHGNFKSFNFVPRNRLARLHEDGSLDLSFVPPQFASCCIDGFAPLTNGQVLVVGPLTYVGESSPRYLSRLNADGTLDESFQPQIARPVYAVAVMEDGRILIGGAFTSVNGVSRMRVARLEPDGELDASFQTDIDSEDYRPITSFTLAEAGRIWVTGEFSRVNGVPRKNIARLFLDGRLDLSFDPGISTVARFSSRIYEAVPEPDGRVLISGYFTNFAGFPRSGNARLHPDGRLDTSFDLVQEPGVVSAPTVSRDGKIWVGGSFQSLNGYARKGLARLNSSLLSPQLDGPVVSNAIVQVGFPTDVGRVYTLEHRDTLESAPWIVPSSIQGDGAYHVHTDPVSAGQRRFYRLRVQ